MDATVETLIQDESLRMVRLDLGPYGTNCYVVSCLRTGLSLVIDAPGEPAEILKALVGTDPHLILITHAHPDHYGALAELRARLAIPVAAHPLDADHLPVTVDRFLKDGDRIEIGALRFSVLHTPGHTPGSLCLLIGDILIAGDTLFPGGPGRTVSPGDFRQILQSLQTKIFPLPDSVRIYSGHGEPTLLSRERPLFEAFAARHHDPNLCGDVVWESA